MGRKDASAWLRFRGRKFGFLAFFLQRFSGLFLLLYLYLHLYDLSLLLVGREAYEAFLEVTSSPAFLPLFMVLFAVAIFHGANGIRVTLNEFGYGVTQTKTFFWILMVAGGLLWVYASYTISTLLTGA